MAPLRGEVQIRDLVFGYQPGPPVLRGVNLTVQRGETIALIGPSGSGKTTLASLIQRLYPLSEGSISIDGVDIRA